MGVRGKGRGTYESNKRSRGKRFNGQMVPVENHLVSEASKNHILCHKGYGFRYLGNSKCSMNTSNVVLKPITFTVGESVLT